MLESKISKVRLRLLKLLSMVAIVSIGVYFVLFNLEENIVFFYPPSKIDKIKDRGKMVRIGGLIKPNSYNEVGDNGIEFTITDNVKDIRVRYRGVLPALFKEGQGVVAKGILNSNNLLTAEELLTKHDEYYRPPSE